MRLRRYQRWMRRTFDIRWFEGFEMVDGGMNYYIRLRNGRRLAEKFVELEDADECGQNH